MSFISEIFRDKSPAISFKALIGNVAVSTPVIRAIKYKAPWMRRDDPELSYMRCPGLFDYSSAGYLITAHTDIHIKANSAGVVVTVSPFRGMDERMTPKPFDQRLVDGAANVDGVKKYAGKVPLPWSVVAKSGYSGHALPALLHADYLDKIFVYPGIVDYDTYHTVNFVFSPIKECEFTIPAGTPLLQVIPFKRESMDACCDRANEEDVDIFFASFPSKVKNFYRKHLHSKKSYSMKCPYEGFMRSGK